MSQRGFLNRSLTLIERVGNLLPHPVTLFALLCLMVIVLSAIAAATGLEVDDPRKAGVPIKAVSLLDADGVRWMFTKLVANFVEFAPLGTVLVALLGVGVAEKSGLMDAVVRGLMLAAPRRVVTPVIIFAGVMSNTASEMGYVVLIPLAAAIYHALGRHPLAGLAAAFAGVSGGYSANLLIGTIDPLLSGITEASARFMRPGYEVHATCNWYYMAGSTFMVVWIGTWLSNRVVEPRLGTWEQSRADPSMAAAPKLERLSPEERRGILFAGLSILVVLLITVYLALPLPQSGAPLPGWGVLRDPKLGTLIPSPLLHSIVALILVFFVVPGVVYGQVTGKMRGTRGVIDAMAGAMSSMGLYIVLVFFAAQFIKYFEYSNLGLILAVRGADLLKAVGADSPVIFIPFIILCALINLLIGSASAKWALTAPIFVPMLMQLGYTPEVIQCAYRIGDSSTNIITPMMSYFGLILAFALKYDRKLEMGTLIATMLPYSVTFLITWTAFFYLWVFVLGIPIGPGVDVHLPPVAAP